MKFIKIFMLIFFNLIFEVKAEDFNTFSSTEKFTNIQNSLRSDQSLYQQIAHEFNLEYENIGKREAAKILSGNGVTVTGGLNSIGFSYKKPFINFGVSVDRNLSPDVFDDKRWIVTDTFIVEIDASKIMGQLKEENAIDISEKNLAAFAGVVFKRKFTWVHYSNSYEDGLMKDFDKLFLPFKSFEFNQLKGIGLNEMLFKEDSISMKAGGIASAPIYNGISAVGGVLAKFEQLSKTEVVSMGDDKILINFEKTNINSIGASIALQADFLKILKMTLLSYDLNYELASSYKIFLQFSQSNLKLIDENDPIVGELKQVIKNKEANLEILTPFLLSEEKKITQTISHKYNFLLLGGQKSSKTQKIDITKNGITKTFFRHFYEKMKFTEDMLGRLFASIIFAITNSDISATQLASDVKQVYLEYDAEKNLLENHESLDIRSENEFDQKLSLKFVSDFKTQKSTGITGQKYKERAQFILDRFSGIDPLAISLIESDKLIAPFHIKGTYQVDLNGIKYFNSQSVTSIFDHFNSLCNEYPKTTVVNFRSIFDNCKRTLQNDYIDYLKDLSHDQVSANEIQLCERKALRYFFFPSKKRAFIKNCLSDLNKLSHLEWLNIPLWQLKNLTNNIVNNSYSKVHFYNLFGVSNVFFYGSFDAVTDSQHSFTTSFHEGAFKGLGAVDHYMRIENLRAPSSVVVDQ